MKKYWLLIFVLIILLVLACSLPSQLFHRQASLSGKDYLMVAPPGSTPTPTPFQPIPPTPNNMPNSQVIDAVATAIPPTPTAEEGSVATEVPIWGDYAGPSVWPDIDIPAPVGILPHPEGQVNILLLGSDQRPYDGGFRTDTIQLLTVNPQEGTVKLTAFPRDLYVYIPGYTVQRINTAMGWGGFEALAQTMEYNFGVRPDYYVLINFWSFKEVVDSMGGINVDSAYGLCDQRDGYETYCVYAGTTWMDGETALWYVRSRYSTSDLDRGRRQQEVLDAIFDRLVSLDGLSRAADLYEIYKNNVTTDLDFDLIAKFIPLAGKLADAQNVQGYSIGEAQIYDWTNTNGAMVLVPLREPVLEVMRQVISEP